MKNYTSVFDHPRKQHAMKIFAKDPETMSELAQMCIDVINHKISGEGATVVGFAMDVQHSKTISNSHSAPLLGEQKFYHTDKNDLSPSSYPGWNGRVWIRYSKSIDGFSSGSFDPTLTYTGSGGSGSYDGPWSGISHSYFRAPADERRRFVSPEISSFDYRFFDMDFPGLSNGETFDEYNAEYKVYEEKMVQYRKEMVWYKVSGKNHPIMPNQPKEPKFHMRWSDINQEILDDAFMDRLVKKKSRRVLNKEYEEEYP